MPRIITIDGPAGVGKSTVARGLADRLGFDYLDTGAMYRAVAWWGLENNISLADEAAVEQLLPGIEIAFDGPRVFCGNDEITALIRTEEMSASASVVAAYPAVRSRLVDLQRQCAAGKNIVCEGRDQGTVVFPGADQKFFLTASAEVRAARRKRELESRGEQVDLAELTSAIRARDERDSRRELAPLIPAEDALIVDTGGLSANEVIAHLEQLCRSR